VWICVCKGLLDVVAANVEEKERKQNAPVIRMCAKGVSAIMMPEFKGTNETILK
jgi:hypothetical protein